MSIKSIVFSIYHYSAKQIASLNTPKTRNPTKRLPLASINHVTIIYIEIGPRELQTTLPPPPPFTATWLLIRSTIHHQPSTIHHPACRMRHGMYHPSYSQETSRNCCLGHKNGGSFDWQVVLFWSCCVCYTLPSLNSTMSTRPLFPIKMEHVHCLCHHRHPSNRNQKRNYPHKTS
jgi:hypothetical protein